MSHKKKKNRRFTIGKNVFKRALIHNRILPASEIDFYDSEWHEWLSRINAGFDKEKKRLEILAKDASKDYIEALAEDYFKAKRISGNMYAALIVSVWANIEIFFSSLCRYCEYCGKPSICKKPNIRQYEKYFKINIAVELEKVNNFQAANCIRALSNAFKHNEGKYIPDKFPIDEALAEKYGIIEYSRSNRDYIDYAKLPIKEMILTAGLFCNELLEKIEEVLKERTEDG